MPRFSDFVESAMQERRPDNPSFEFYAAHYLVGSGLTCGDLDGHVRTLAHELKKQFDRGIETAEMQKQSVS